MFKEYFKKYKAKKADLTGVYNLKDEDIEKHDRLLKLNLKAARADFFGLRPANEWEAYELKDAPGLIFIKNPFTACGQRYWIIQSLRAYTAKPNRTNLDIFNYYVEEIEDWWKVCQQKNDRELLRKLRWVTLGYHHNWDTKEYSETARNPFPEDLSSLSKYIANVLGYGDYNPEAAIVNFYHMDSTLSGHTDHSENDLEAPLISISFGQTAVFMLGGKTLEAKPVAMFLHSGDIVVMSKESRLCYHGVPKILQANDKPWNEDARCENSEVPACLDESIINSCMYNGFWKPYQDYIKTSRININIRQVLKSGQSVLCTS